MKIAPINKDLFDKVSTNSKVADELGLAESDLETIRTKLVGEDNKEESLQYIKIDKCIPYYLAISSSNENIATILFLCSNAESGEMFLLYHNYIIENKEDIELLEEIPLFSSNQSMSDNLAILMFNKHLKSYNTDLAIYTVEDDDPVEKDKNMFYTLAYTKESKNNIIKMYMDHSVLDILAYTNSYILDYDDSHDYTLALTLFVDGYDKPLDCNIIFIDDIKDITYIASVNKKIGLYHVAFKIADPEDTSKYITASKYVYIDNRVRTNVNKTKFNELMTGSDNKYSNIIDYNIIINDECYEVVKAVSYDKDGNMNKSILLLFDEDTENKLIDLIIRDFSK